MNEATGVKARLAKCQGYPCNCGIHTLIIAIRGLSDKDLSDVITDFEIRWGVSGSSMVTLTPTLGLSPTERIELSAYLKSQLLTTLNDRFRSRLEGELLSFKSNSRRLLKHVKPETAIKSVLEVLFGATE
jgi:hypothetical protein